MKLKKDYEACFKEGFKLGTRLARAKINIMRASDSKRLNDEAMVEHYKQYAELWTRLARNCGRSFCPPEALSDRQSSFDFGDVELLDHKYGDDREDRPDEHKKVQVGGSGY
tara:strand:+ start:47 stop:379 length:333 start_codon:yes stop_codon:yes gene_type:complete